LSGNCQTGTNANACIQLMGSQFTSDTTMTCTWRNVSGILGLITCSGNTFTATVDIICADVE
jgi:hypothetical protein